MSYTGMFLAPLMFVIGALVGIFTGIYSLVFGLIKDHLCQFFPILLKDFERAGVGSDSRGWAYVVSLVMIPTVTIMALSGVFPLFDALADKFSLYALGNSVIQSGYAAYILIVGLTGICILLSLYGMGVKGPLNWLSAPLIFIASPLIVIFKLFYRIIGAVYFGFVSVLHRTMKHFMGDNILTVIVNMTLITYFIYKGCEALFGEAFSTRGGSPIHPSWLVNAGDQLSVLLIYLVICIPSYLLLRWLLKTTR